MALSCVEYLKRAPFLMGTLFCLESSATLRGWSPWDPSKNSRPSGAAREHRVTGGTILSARWSPADDALFIVSSHRRRSLRLVFNTNIWSARSPTLPYDRHRCLLLSSTFSCCLLPIAAPSQFKRRKTGILLSTAYMMRFVSECCNMSTSF